MAVLSRHITGTFEKQYSNLRRQLVETPVVDRGEWQAKRQGDDPRFRVHELLNVAIQFQIPSSVGGLISALQPNLPWAEQHFRERISGEPLNPGEQYKNWPWYEQGVEEHKETGQFSHTYMERIWPKRAGHESRHQPPNRGIRFEWGDLADVVDLLQMSPMTRQAFLPIWFPEDTGAVHRQRVPCTIGYHFQFDAERRFHTTYFARSIDFVRYLRDDAYLAACLAAWVVGGLILDAHLGTVTMNIANLHCFDGDLPKLWRDLVLEEEDQIHGV